VPWILRGTWRAILPDLRSFMRSTGGC